MPANIAHGDVSKNDQHDIAYKYVGDTRQFEFTAPKSEGAYDVRFNNPATNKELTHTRFSEAVDKAAAKLTLSKNVFAPGEKIEIKFNASATYPTNSWIGILEADKPHGSTKTNDQHDISYKYLQGKTNGTFEFTAPKKEGQYDFRMNETTNDKELTSVAFSVVKTGNVSDAKQAPKDAGASKEAKSHEIDENVDVTGLINDIMTILDWEAAHTKSN
ncbi:MAG: hypothetical protein JXR76_08405 [Deltaproteobacteria bacterium]|nr:hypothetical protein [Deltaproteobacteria bacterium]